MRTLLALCLTMLSWLSLQNQAHACKCMPPDLGRSYDNADHVVHVRIDAQLPSSSTARRYLARLVDDDYKGCLEAGRRVVIETGLDSASCGMELTRGAYLLHGSSARRTFGLLTLHVGTCDANARWADVSPEHLAFLNSRFVCCGDSCACNDGNPSVNCFVDPCQVATCDVAGASCRSNYCGGCNAEWYDASGARVCLGTTPSACNYDDPQRRYVAKSPEACKAVRFACGESEQQFFDACGCGCEASAQSACRVGGCSGQLCVGPGEPDITTCQWRDEYACYRGAECTLQSNGRCGFTQTPELISCLERSR